MKSGRPGVAAARVYLRVLPAPKLFIGCLMVLAVACGGGGGSGGGGGGGGGSSLRVTLITTSLAWSYFPAEQPTSREVRASATGEYSGTIYVGAIVENDGVTNAIDPQIPVAIAGAQATATVIPATGLQPGTYTGRILFLACSDPACNNRIGGTPLQVPFTVTVLTPIQVSPTVANVNAVSGTPASLPITVQPGTGETSFTTSTTSSFIQVANPTAGGFTLSLPSLPAGTYTGNVTITGSRTSQTTLPVTYTVTEPPGGQYPLSLSPTSMTFSTTEAATSAPQLLTVTEPSWKPGVRTPTVTYSGASGWLEVEAAAGGFNVRANAGNLSAGTYEAVLLVEPNALPANVVDPFGIGMRSVNVSVTVGAGLVRPADVTHVVDSDDSFSALSGSVPISIAGGLSGSVYATENADWLHVGSPALAGGSLSYSIDLDWLRNTAANFQEYTATVELSAPSSAITPVQFDIHFTPKFAEVTGVGPARQLAGPMQLVVAGRGFAALANPATRLTGVPVQIPQGVTPVSDNKLLVDTDVGGPFTYSISIGNGLGVPAASRSFRVITPPSPTYATVPTGNYLQMLRADDERGAVYGLRIDGTLLRFRPDGGGWTSDTVALADVTNFGLMNDGSLLVTTGSAGASTVHVLDGGSLAETSTLQVPGGIAELNWTVPGLPVSADDKVWLPLKAICGGSTARLGYYDPADGAVHTLDVAGQPCPWLQGLEFAMARDGERMVLMPHAFVDDPKPLLYMDASDRILRSGNSQQYAVDSWTNSAHSSDDGSRTVLDLTRVVDAEQSLVGNLAVPDYGAAPGTAQHVAAIVSPDGTRTYVMAYRAADKSQVSQLPPRVYVFDSSTPVGNANLPVLGYFEVPDYPACHAAFSGCDETPLAAISMDGRTLFIAGDDLFLVVPVPAEGMLSPAAAAAGGPAAFKTHPWRLDSR
jgi:hypothetical protein